MDDKELIRLFQARDERAVAECERQYAAFCRRIAANLLDSPEDIEEVLSDVWLAAWQRIPPLVPDSVKAFLGKLVRDISISRFRCAGIPVSSSFSTLRNHSTLNLSCGSFIGQSHSQCTRLSTFAEFSFSISVST